MPLYARGDGPPKLTVGIPDYAKCFTVADLGDITALILDDNVAHAGTHEGYPVCLWNESNLRSG